ncbi:hypothetical protein D3870_01770 [Noviherbaspirillum cavernae]|uniref:Uncharacterized protein n=1 Tax=Noviherbaspirillum cavernae TaxID=2320862 RepID=A0A418WXE2_9BURK|nr:hypothetical protein D3870_01770 [Noviherbaspirillum cavernae]
MLPLIYASGGTSFETALDAGFSIVLALPFPVSVAGFVLTDAPAFLATASFSEDLEAAFDFVAVVAVFPDVSFDGWTVLAGVFAVGGTTALVASLPAPLAAALFVADLVTVAFIVSSL